MDTPEVRFAQARNGRLAYQQWGDGEDIVSVPPLAQTIEMSWGHPVVVAMLERFGRIGRFLHYDKRGTGASGRISRPPDRDERVDDMRAVMDAAGIERAHLAGNSLGGWVALELAKRDAVASVTGLCAACLWTGPLAPKPFVAHRVAKALRPALPLLLRTRFARRAARTLVWSPQTIVYAARPRGRAALLGKCVCHYVDFFELDSSGGIAGFQVPTPTF